MTEKPHARPLYIDEGSDEYAILAGAEKFFAERDEKLRYELVKRVFQWMLDTDENGFFEQTSGTRRAPVDIRELFASSYWRTRVLIRPSDEEMESYLWTVERDALRGEIDAMHDYTLEIHDQLPPEYESRREFIERRTHYMQAGRSDRDFRWGTILKIGREWRIKTLPSI